MENGKVRVDYLQELPEEYRKDAEELTERLESCYNKIKIEIDASVDSVLRKIGLGNIYEQDYRKKVGLYLKGNKVPHQACIFPMLLDKKDVVNKYIMKQIRPLGNKLEK